mgnify:FL=1
MDLQYSIPENAEVISSIGVSLAMVRDVIERVIPNPTEQDIAAMKKEAIDACIDSGASADTVEVHIEIDNQSGKVTAIATGSTEVKTTDLLKECTEKEARELAATDFGSGAHDIECTCRTDHFYVFTAKKRIRHRFASLIKKDSSACSAPMPELSAYLQENTKKQSRLCGTKWQFTNLKRFCGRIIIYASDPVYATIAQSISIRMNF